MKFNYGEINKRIYPVLYNNIKYLKYEDESTKIKCCFDHKVYITGIRS